MDNCITVIGAREHNLKNITVDIPKQKVVVFTGVSGSGKSSVVFDTIYAEAQRQLIETFSAFSRRYMPKIPKPDVDGIRNLSPVIRIDQKRMGENRRSTVGTATEISTYLRLLYSRCGTPFIGPSFYFSFNNPEGMCQACSGVGSKIEIDTDRLLDMDKSMAEGGIRHQFYQPGNFYYKIYRASGLFDVNKPLKEFSKEEMDRLLYLEPTKIGEDRLGGVLNATMEGVVTGIIRRQMGKEDLSDREAKFFKVTTCKACNGTRINERARSVTINGKNIAELSAMELTELREFLAGSRRSGGRAHPRTHPVAAKPAYRHRRRLPVARPAGSYAIRRRIAAGQDGQADVLRPGEPDLRVRRAQHRDCTRGTCTGSSRCSGGCETGATVSWWSSTTRKSSGAPITSSTSGPGAGTQGGHVLFSGSVEDLKKADTVTGHMFAARSKQSWPRRKATGSIEVKNVSLHNLKNVSVKIPTGILVAITGVAGSGKSTLINDVFVSEHPEAVVVDQSPIGRSSRSNPATYVGAFDDIRKAFAAANSVEPGLFSFNSAGACPKCGGLGYVEVEMAFLDSVRMTCPECQGKTVYTGRCWR